MEFDISLGHSQESISVERSGSGVNELASNAVESPRKGDPGIANVGIDGSWLCPDACPDGARDRIVVSRIVNTNKLLKVFWTHLR